MTFLNPLLLFGLLAAGIPLAIHFLGKRRPRRVQFSAMVFLEEVRRQQFRRLKFRNALLLLLRTAAIACLVLAFARPTIRRSIGAFGHEGASAMVVVLDDGPSMGYEGSYGRRIDWARRQLADMLSLVHPNDWALLIRTSNPQLVLPLTRQTLENLKTVSEWSGDGVAALQHAADILGKSEAANRELYVVSDLTGPPWRNLHSVQFPDRTVGYLLAPESEQVTNLAVDSVSVGDQFVRAGRPINVRATLKNTGNTDVRDALADIWLDQRRVQRQTLSVPAGGTAVVTFGTSVPVSGWLTGRVEISDDPLLADNVRSFALFVPEETRVAILGPEAPSREFLTALFTAADSTTPYRVAVGTERSISQDAVEQADVLIINEQVPSDERVLNWIRNAVHRRKTTVNAPDGMGILFVMGPSTDIAAANRVLLPLFTGDRLSGIAGRQTNGSEGFFALDTRRVADPLVQDLFTSTAKARLPRFGAYGKFVVRTSLPVISFTSGDPWIVRGESESVRGAIVTAGLSPEWSDLAYRGAVVPLFHRLVQTLARPSSFVAEYPAGVAVKRPLVRAATKMMLIAPDRLERQVVASGQPIPSIDVGVPSPMGCWTITADGEPSDIFAVNLDRSESQLQAIDAGDFARSVNLPSLTRLSDKPAAEVREARLGTELAVLFLLAALAFIAAELLLMRGIGRAGADEPSNVR